MYLGSWRKGVIQHYLAKYSQLAPFIADTTVLDLESSLTRVRSAVYSRLAGTPL